jgi:hypothetical protein
MKVLGTFDANKDGKSLLIRIVVALGLGHRLPHHLFGGTGTANFSSTVKTRDPPRPQDLTNDELAEKHRNLAARHNGVVSSPATAIPKPQRILVNHNEAATGTYLRIAIWKRRTYETDVVGECGIYVLNNVVGNLGHLNITAS